MGSNNKKEWTCQYCNQVFQSRRKLYAHFKICEEKEKLPKDSLGKTINIEGQKKSAETKRKLSKLGKYKCKGHYITPEIRVKLAQKMQERKNIINCQCNYNIKACEYINNLNKEKNWNLQHALNGGEYKIGPYHVDGYDKELNIVFEYDEKHSRHTQTKGILRDKCRQAYIIEKLNCEFWRYSEKDNLLYKVDKDKNLEEIKILQEQYPNIKIKNIKRKLKVKKESKYQKDKSGKGNPNIIAEEIWLERKERILNSGIDLMKFGWVGKVKKLTKLSQRELENTLKHFNSEFEGKYFRRKFEK